MKHRLFVYRTSLVVLFLFLQVCLVSVRGYEGGPIVSPTLSNPVTIDGKWTTPSEWSDASVTVMVQFQAKNATAYLYSKHDASNFYFLVDFVSAASLNAAADFASISIDPLRVGSSSPQPGDRRFDSTYPVGGYMSIGTGASDWNRGNPLPKGVNIAMSMSSSPNLALPHEITEFQIPFSIFPGMLTTIGFRATAGYYSSTLTAAVWPKDSSGPNPATWGELTLSSSRIPEFWGAWLILAMTVLSTLILLRKWRHGACFQVSRSRQP